MSGCTRETFSSISSLAFAVTAGVTFWRAHDMMTTTSKNFQTKMIFSSLLVFGVLQILLAAASLICHYPGEDLDDFYRVGDGLALVMSSVCAVHLLVATGIIAWAPIASILIVVQFSAAVLIHKASCESPDNIYHSSHTLNFSLLAALFVFLGTWTSARCLMSSNVNYINKTRHWAITLLVGGTLSGVFAILQNSVGVEGRDPQERLLDAPGFWHSLFHLTDAVALIGFVGVASVPYV
jgi:hypothetical protein